MFILPEQTTLGTLELIEIYEFYDYPRLVSCWNRIGQRYFALSVDEQREKYTWLYAPVSHQRFNTVRSGRVDLRTAFVSAEEGFVYKVVTNSNGVVTIDQITSDTIPQEWLPEVGENLELETATAYPIEELDEVAVARASHRDTLNVLLKLPTHRTTEAASRQLGVVLSSLQELFDALGQSVLGTPTLKGAIPLEILSKTQMNVSQVFPGSFGIQMKADEASDLFGSSLAGDAIAEFVHLLDAKDDEDLLSNKLHQLKGRAAAKYRSLLDAIGRMETDVVWKWGSVDENRSASVLMTKAEISSALRAVTDINVEMSEAIPVRCRLIGINVRTKTYEIWGLEDDQKYSGKVADEALPEVQHATVNEEYIAVLKQLLEVQALTGEEKVKWLLTGLRTEDIQ